ncbi:MAG TPA: outer membrane beta-barrel protein [Xanthobacteraceae bacterium]|jgi:outer membrane immunogenic protein|nr:outer membrane beta-barrel protein [Xanthobacteraceae bacterium]
MKNVVLAGLALVALAAAVPAVAADMPLKAPMMAPVVVDPWTGFYAGANVGYSWGNWDSSSLSPLFPTGAGVTGTTAPGLASAILSDFSSTTSRNVKGWVGGGQVGYNWLNGSWLYGVEADIQATGQRASLNGGATVFRAPFFDGVATITQNETNSWKLPWFATFRGRLGVTYDQTWLFYATGGLAVGRAEFSNTTSLTLATTSPPASTTAAVSLSEETTRVGFAVGGGVEKAIDAHWRVKAEYLFVDLGSHTFLAGTGADTNIKIRDNIVRVGFNYRFGAN